MAADVTAATAVLKTVFTPKMIEKLVLDESKWPLWSILEKRKADAVKGAFGLKFVIPMHLNDTQAVGSDLSANETKAATSGQGGEIEYKAFEVTPTVYYGAAKVSGISMSYADGNDKGSFVDQLAEEMKGAMRSMANRFAIYAYGAGYGTLGKISGAPTSTTVKVRRGDRRKFRKGMDLVAGLTEAGAVRSATSIRVTKIASDGTLTLSADPTALSWADGDFLFAKSDHDLTGAGIRKVITGLGAYNPTTEPATTTTLHGVDISTDWRLSGMRIASGTGADILEDVKLLAVELDAEGEAPTHAVANTEVWNKIVALLPDETVFKTTVGDGTIGYETVKIRCPSGVVELLSDPSADPTELRMFNIKYLFWAYNGDAFINTIDEDGNMIRKVSGEDAFGVAFRAIIALCCDKPNSLGVLTGIA